MIPSSYRELTSNVLIMLFELFKIFADVIFLRVVFPTILVQGSAENFLKLEKRNGKVDVHGSFNQCMINVIIRWGVRSLVLLRNEINKTFNCNSSNGKTFV